jgi:RNA polymerase sigma-70 factor (sigma-E family)
LAERSVALAPGKWIGQLARWQSMGHEQDEFADFYRASRDSCLRAVTAVVGDRELAEEQVAEAFTRAWTSWGQVRRHAAPRAWVVRTALNLGVSWWRRRRREVPLADHDAAVPAGPGDGVDPALIAALRRLPARQREVLALRIFLDLDTETTAKVVGVAPGTVTAHLSRAVAALRRDLQPAHTDTTEVIR